CPSLDRCGFAVGFQFADGDRAALDLVDGLLQHRLLPGPVLVRLPELVLVIARHVAPDRDLLAGDVDHADAAGVHGRHFVHAHADGRAGAGTGALAAVPRHGALEPRLRHRVAELGIDPLADLERLRTLALVELGPVAFPPRGEQRVAALGGEVHPGVAGGVVPGAAASLPVHLGKQRLRRLVAVARRAFEVAAR